MIPEEKRGAVARALETAFGVTEADEVHAVSGGLSTAVVRRIVVKGKAYLLRVILRTDAMGDPTRQIDCMRKAAEAGVSPEVRYASVEDRVLITDFVVAKPMPADAGLRMARTLRTVHGLEGFPRSIHYLNVMDGIVTRFRGAGILPESATDEVLRNYARFREAYPLDDNHVACHNDLKPQNTIFDGERMMLVDWEAAFLNDRYSDLAQVANYYTKDEPGEEALLEEYFCGDLGARAGEYERARFFLMQQAVHVFFAAFLLPMAAKAGALIEAGTEMEDFRAVHDRIAWDERTLRTAEGKAQYGMAHLAWARSNMRTRRFDEALKFVAGQDAVAE